MAKRKSNNNLKYALTAVITAVVILVLLIIVKSPATPSTTNGTTSAPSSLISKITSIKQSVFSAIGLGSADNLPKAISGAPLTSNNKPEVLYIGAEYCPYCATERWPMVIALSKFGTFTGLKETHSSSTDVYPNTQTFSFYQSTYTSSYITFDGVETYSNQPQGSAYVPLQKPTAAQQALMTKLDAPPYVASDSSQGIPFVDFGNKYIISGATYSPAVLQGLSYSQIANDLSDTNSAVAKGAIGSANALTAAICSITNNQPGSVCSNPTIMSAESTLNGG